MNGGPSRRRDRTSPRNIHAAAAAAPRPVTGTSRFLRRSKATKQTSWVYEHPFEMKYGGFTVTTTCCANVDDFQVGVDMPCNGAGGLRVGAAVVVAAAGALLLGT